METPSDSTINLIRAMVRPICTIWGFVILSLMIINGMEIPLYFIGFVGGLLSIYTGERFIQKMKGDLK